MLSFSPIPMTSTVETAEPRTETLHEQRDRLQRQIQEHEQEFRRVYEERLQAAYASVAQEFEEDEITEEVEDQILYNGPRKLDHLLK